MDGTAGSLRAITPDGAELPGDLALPHEPARAVVVVCHPHPDYGGDRFNPVVDALHRALSAAGFASARFDFRRPVRGNEARAEVDVRAMLDTAAAAVADVPLVLAGYSFGAAVGLSVAAEREDIAAIVAIAPPLPMMPLDVAPAVPTRVVVPAHDQFGPPEAVAPIIASWPRVELSIVESADHFLLGQAARVAADSVAWLGHALT